MSYARTHPDGFTVSDDPARLDVAAVHAYLSRSYWSPGISRDLVERAAAGSLAFGLYAPDGAQIGYARVVTDRATYGYLCDVYVLESHAGRGLGTWMVGSVMAHPDLADLRRFDLRTHDAHGLYARFGFEPLAHPEYAMERRTPRVPDAS